MSASVDEDLHSRQIAVYGRQAMGKLSTSSVLVSGLNGLGIEICKNVILAGCKRVVLHDGAKVAMRDLGSQFYLTEEDVGKNRAEACEKRLAELNPAVTVDIAPAGPLEKGTLADAQVVVLVGGTLKEAERVDALCREGSVAFIHTQIAGLFGSVFTDFGKDFVCLDATGEEVKTAIVANITNAEKALVACVDEQRLDFEEGDLVKFSEVRGMTELNGAGPFKVHDVKPYSFCLDLDTTKFGAYTGGGLVAEVKQPKELKFKSLTEALDNPGEMMDADLSKWGRSYILHLFARALSEYQVRNNGSLPPSNDSTAADQVLKIAKELVPADKESPMYVDLEAEENAKLFKELARAPTAVLNPMAAVFGGIVGQEVVKAITQKFHPVFQFVYMDFLECLADNAADLASSEFTVADRASEGRYQDQIEVFGRTFQNKLRGLNYFLVGAGALGCEFIKNFAMMGLACSPSGKLTVTDDDTIEKSNLSRQFLFRNYMIGKSKSAAAADTVRAMNKDLNIVALQDRVSPNTEDLFDCKFWSSLDGVCNALDNVKARLYVDSRCVFFSKSLLESGTLGTKCNTQVVIPHVTQNYGATQDPPEKQAPDCTLHNFPHNINHCLTWARSEFTGHFDSAPSDTKAYMDSKDFYADLKKSFVGEHDILEKLQNVQNVVSKAPKTFQDCVEWARLVFEDYFSNRIKQLTFSFPEDAKSNTGLPFWTPPKRFPKPLKFDPEDSMHIGFVTAAANLRANVFKVADAKPEERRDPAFIRSCVNRVAVPEFTPKAGVKIDTDENKNDNQQQQQGQEEDQDLEEQIQGLLKSLPKPGDAAAVAVSKVQPEEFEKDDDTNFHMDFIAATGNLRARNYGIQEVDALQAKLIAGRIIPAIATTTAFATGLVCLELYKLHQKKKFEAYRNTFANLALPLFSMAEPEPPTKFKSRVEKTVPDPVNHPDYVEEEEIVAMPEGYTNWDRIDVRLGDVPLQKYVDYFEETLKVSCTDISVLTSDSRGVCLYRDTDPKNAKTRLGMKLSELIEKVAKDKFGTKPYILPSCGFENDDGAVVETPQIVFWL